MGHPARQRPMQVSPLRRKYAPPMEMTDFDGFECRVRLHDAEAFSHEALEAWAPDEVVGQLLAGEHVEGSGAGVGDHLRGFVDGEGAVLRDGLEDEVHH
jgi:hypothetical protein